MQWWRFWEWEEDSKKYRFWTFIKTFPCTQPVLNRMGVEASYNEQNHRYTGKPEGGWRKPAFSRNCGVKMNSVTQLDKLLPNGVLEKSRDPQSGLSRIMAWGNNSNSRHNIGGLFSMDPGYTGHTTCRYGGLVASVGLDLCVILVFLAWDTAFCEEKKQIFFSLRIVVFSLSAYGGGERDKLYPRSSSWFSMDVLFSS